MITPHLIAAAKPTFPRRAGLACIRSSNDFMNPLACLRILAALALLALAGCVETRFESPIGDNIETCDTEWKGLWLGTDDDKGVPDDTTAFYVNDECQFIVVDQPEKNGPLKQIHVPVNYVHASGKDYIVVADTSIKSLVNIRPPHGLDPVPDKSFFFARYRVHGDRIELYQVDSERTAKLVIEGKLGGTVDKTKNELHVYVQGTRAQMLDMVRTQSIFDEKKPVKLVRSRQTLDQFQQSKLRAPAKTSP